MPKKVYCESCKDVSELTNHEGGCLIGSDTPLYDCKRCGRPLPEYGTLGDRWAALKDEDLLRAYVEKEQELIGKSDLEDLLENREIGTVKGYLLEAREKQLGPLYDSLPFVIFRYITRDNDFLRRNLWENKLPVDVASDLLKRILAKYNERIDKYMQKALTVGILFPPDKVVEKPTGKENIIEIDFSKSPLLIDSCLHTEFVWSELAEDVEKMLREIGYS